MYLYRAATLQTTALRTLKVIVIYFSTHFSMITSEIALMERSMAQWHSMAGKTSAHVVGQLKWAQRAFRMHGKESIIII